MGDIKRETPAGAADLIVAAQAAGKAYIIALQEARKGAGEDGRLLRPLSIAINNAQTAYLWQDSALSIAVGPDED